MMKTQNVFFLATIFLLITLCSCQKNEGLVIPTEPILTETELYFYSKRDGVNNIYKLDAQGNEMPIITDSEHHDWWVRVSPNKDKLLWYKSPLDVPTNKEYNNYEAAELWMANVDGSNPQKVIDLEDNNWTSQGVADWSPDGTELVMAVTDDSGHWHIYITDAEGKNPQKISQRNSFFADPSWSPDGEKIVYTAFPIDYVGVNLFKLEIHTMNKDGSNEIQLTDDELRDHDPYWSPDGKEIGFETQWNLLHCFIGKWSLRKYNFDSETVTDILKDDTGNAVPRWSKDSKKLYFARLECGQFAQIMSIERDGSNLTPILSSDTFPYHDCDVVE